MSVDGRTTLLNARLERCEAKLAGRDQRHVLRWWKALTDDQRDHLLGEIESIDWDVVDPLIKSHVRRKPDELIPTRLEPVEVYRREATPEQVVLYDRAAARGESMIRDGKVAAFTVAGGQGTRLGFDGPKGAFPITPVRHKSLFQLFAETILAARRRFGASIPWYIMTGPDNHESTVAFFEARGFFGLPSDDVRLFPQGVLPVFGLDGRLLLADRHRLAFSPDGHGGSLRALAGSGALADMRSRGVEIISYFQVDNPLVRPVDPLFVGLHAETGSEMSIKVTPKADDFEHVGNVCLHRGRVCVIEYSNLPDQFAAARRPDGTRLLNAANLAIHLLNVGFVDRIVGQRFELPYHRAEKAVKCLDEQGRPHTPDAPNAVKLETFVFDALAVATNPLVLEVDRAEEFSPVKNARGVDSVESAFRHQSDRAARWLEAAGVEVPRGADGIPDGMIEIAPSFALDAEAVKARSLELPKLESGIATYIE